MEGIGEERREGREREAGGTGYAARQQHQQRPPIDRDEVGDRRERKPDDAIDRLAPPDGDGDPRRHGAVSAAKAIASLLAKPTLTWAPGSKPSGSCTVSTMT